MSSSMEVKPNINVVINFYFFENWRLKFFLSVLNEFIKIQTLLFAFSR
jgi:hypothetical protein